MKFSWEVILNISRLEGVFLNLACGLNSQANDFQPLLDESEMVFDLPSVFVEITVKAFNEQIYQTLKSKFEIRYFDVNI